MSEERREWMELVSQLRDELATVAAQAEWRAQEIERLRGLLPGEASPLGEIAESSETEQDAHMDIVDRLRLNDVDMFPECHEAAQEIERLRTALAAIASDSPDQCSTPTMLRLIAAQALAARAAGGGDGHIGSH